MSDQGLQWIKWRYFMGTCWRILDDIEAEAKRIYDDGSRGKQCHGSASTTPSTHTPR